MSQPVRVSGALVLKARLTGKAFQRSNAGQVEFRAGIGRFVEPLLKGKKALALCRKAQVRPLSRCLESADTPEGRRRVADFLGDRPFPHYEAVPGVRGLLVRIEAKGRRTVGRFVNRRFRSVKPKAAAR